MHQLWHGIGQFVYVLVGECQVRVGRMVDLNRSQLLEVVSVKFIY